MPPLEKENFARGTSYVGIEDCTICILFFCEAQCNLTVSFLLHTYKINPYCAPGTFLTLVGEMTVLSELAVILKKLGLIPPTSVQSSKPTAFN